MSVFDRGLVTQIFVSFHTSALAELFQNFVVHTQSYNMLTKLIC